MAEYDQSAEWRGIVTTTVQQHSEKLATLNGDLREIRNNLSRIDTSVIETKGEVAGLRRDLEQISGELTKNRQSEIEDLQKAIRESKVNWRQFLIYVVAPIITGIIVAIIIAHLVEPQAAHMALIGIWNALPYGI